MAGDGTTAQLALRSALRDVVGPAAREHGYKGSAPNWRKTNAAGDTAVINVQSSSWGSRDEVPCIINIAVAPEPWLRWRKESANYPWPKQVHESLGLYRNRLEASPDFADHNGWWSVRADEAQARAAASDMVAALNSGGWSLLDGMLEPGGMMRHVRADDLGFFHGESYCARAAALLLMDAGPSPELDEQLRVAGGGAAKSANVIHFERFVREQAALAAGRR